MFIQVIRTCGKGLYMDLPDFVISDDLFFSLGLSALFSQELKGGRYFIVDMQTSNYTQISHFAGLGKRIFAFISTDIDYYALKHLKNVTLLDRRTPTDEMVSTFLLDNPQCNYNVKHRLSDRENKLLTCMLEGYSTREISDRLAMNMKTFYAYRTRIIKKLQITNRIFLYKTIASHVAMIRQFKDLLVTQHISRDE